MYPLFSLWALTLVTASLFDFALGILPPVAEVYRRQLDAKNRLTRRDLVCIEDEILQSLQFYLDDSIPFCSSFIGIPQETSTSTFYVKTTVTELTTVATTRNAVATVASGTVTITITPTPTAPVAKRQATDVPPATKIISSCLAPSGQNLTLINGVSTACSCIFIPETTVTLVTTALSTKALSGIDYQFITATSLVTSGVATVTLTVIPSITPTVVLTTTPTTIVSSVVPVSTGVLPSPLNITAAPPGSSDLPVSVTTSPTLTSETIDIPPFSLDASGREGGGLESSISPTTTPTSPIFTGISSVVPPVSVNTTGPAPGSSGLPASVTSIPVSSGPAAPSNFTIPTGPTTVAAPSNSSSPTTSGVLPSSTGSCPAENGTTYTTLGQLFLILCDTNFIGPNSQGFYVDSFYACVQECALVNVGFSQSRCYAASYIPNNGVGSDCFFKTLNNSRNAEYDPKATSAILLNNPLPTNFTVAPNDNTSSTSSSIALSTSIAPNSSYPTGPTALPSSNVTSLPFTSIISANATILPSGFPTTSPNITSAPSSFPTISINSYSVPPFSGFPSGNEHRTAGASSGVGTGFPSATSNASVCSGVTITITEGASAATVTSYVTTTIFTATETVYSVGT